VGTILRQLLCGILATSSFITARSPSRIQLPVPSVERLLLPVERARTDEVLRRVNEERAALHLDLLRRSPELDAAADERAQDMSARDYFAHISPDGVTPGDQIRAAGYQALLCGENIASGYSSAREVVKAWMASPSHRANILEPRYRDIGLAYSEAPGTESGVLWVQEFGEPAPDRLMSTGSRGPVRHDSGSGRPRPARVARADPSGS